MFRIPARGRHISQEPQLAAEHLLGMDLATFRRRIFAFCIDLILFGVLTTAIFMGLTAWSFHRADPTLFQRGREAFAKPESDENRILREKVTDDVYYQIFKRCPTAFTPDLAAKIQARDTAALREHFSESALTIGFGNGKTELSEGEDGQNTLLVGTDLLMGPFGGVLGWGGFFVIWFTFWSLVTNGRSPGKFLFRIRVIRLDGKKLNLWDCFSRSGGYGASAATLMLGFLEAIWHPNRQAIHDRIAGTVVVRNQAWRSI